MKIISTCLVAALALAATACNEAKTGANDRVLFVPDECGNAGGCDFDDSVGVYGTISVTIQGIDGFPTAGLELDSDDPGVFTIEPRSDIAGVPAWDLTAHAPGVARIEAWDGDVVVDFIEVGVQEVQALTMVPFAGDIVGPTVEDGYDEVYTVNANEPVSWFIRPLIAGDAVTMGRFAFETILDAGEPAITEHETDSSDRPNGYLYVNLPAGDYPVRFEITEDVDVFVEALIRAQ